MSDANDSVPYVREWGAGTRIAVLVHGLSADSRSWWRLGPELARRGYRVLALDLPGHGRGPRLGEYHWKDMVEALPSAVESPADGAPVELAIGHSLGGRLLAQAITSGALAPERTIFEDPAWAPGGDGAAQGFLARKNLTAEQIAAANPGWAEQARTASLDALAQWDTATVDLVREQSAYDPGPELPPALIVLADPSPVVPPESVAALIPHGHTVRVVPGAGHNIHNDQFDGFLTAIQDRL